MKIITACLLAGAISAHGISRLGSKSVQDYLEYKPMNTQSVCVVYTTDGNCMTGTLIHPNVVLTSAHFDNNISHVMFGERKVNATRYLKHPDHVKLVDMALIYIETVEGITPAKLIDPDTIDSRSLENEHVYIAGAGDMRSGSSSTRVYVNTDRQIIWATNVIDWPTGMAYWCDFDGLGPETNTLDGNYKPTEMEGMLSPGDSGGPMFLQTTGELIGVARSGSHRVRDWVYDNGKWVTIVQHINTFIKPNLPVEQPVWEPVISRDFDPKKLDKPTGVLPSSPEDLKRIEQLEQQVSQQQTQLDTLQRDYDTQSEQLEQVTLESESYYNRLYFPLLVGWRYSPDHGWLYTDTETFPYIYRSENETWYFFARELQDGQNGRAFYNYTTEQWEIWK